MFVPRVSKMYVPSCGSVSRNWTWRCVDSILKLMQAWQL